MPPAYPALSFLSRSRKLKSGWPRLGDRTLRLDNTTNLNLALPCRLPACAYHEDIDSPTFDALQRIMDAMRPRVSYDKQLTDDWLRVTAWMDEVATEIDDLETLGTDDPRRELREVR